jgi:hypothetical protein
MTKLIAVIVKNLATPKAAAKLELWFTERVMVLREDRTQQAVPLNTETQRPVCQTTSGA